MVRELTKSRSWNRETCNFSLVREFVKIQNIVLEFVNRTPPGGASLHFKGKRESTESTGIAEDLHLSNYLIGL